MSHTCNYGLWCRIFINQLFITSFPGSIPVLKIIKVGVFAVDIALGVKGKIMSDIVAYEVTLIEFATSKKIDVKFGFNSTDEMKQIKNLKSFRKYNINVRFNYLDGSKGARIPNQQFRTRECRKFCYILYLL